MTEYADDQNQNPVIPSFGINEAQHYDHNNITKKEKNSLLGPIRLVAISRQ